MLLDQVANSMPKERFRMVSAPGWYDSAFVIPRQVFARGNNEPEIYVDPDSDGHLGAFVLGEGSLKDWQELVAKPSRRSSSLRLSIAAGLAAPFLRPLGLDSFGINWFSDPSHGKTLCLFVAASVVGLVGVEGLPGWADSQAGIEDLARGHRDCVMPLDETGDGEHQMPLGKKARMLAFLIGRNRPRKLSKRYERNHNLTNREFRVIVLSSSERALGQIARAAGERRLGGEEVRFVDIPASNPNSAGIFDADIKPAPGKTLAHEGTAVDYARWTLWLRGHRSAVVSPEPFAAVIFCTADRKKVDYRTRSKWSRVLRYTAEFKDPGEPLRDFIKRKGGINKCAARFTRRLGRGARAGD